MNTTPTTTYEVDGAFPSATADDELLHETAAPMPAPPVPTYSMPGMIGHVLVSALAMTGACVAVVAIASSQERGSPWAGMNALASGMGLASRRRPSGHFHGGTAAALGLIAGGSLALGVLERVVARASAGKVPPGIATAVGGAVADRIFLRRGFFGAMQRTLGTRGTIAKYAAMGIATALASRRRLPWMVPAPVPPEAQSSIRRT